MTTLPNTPGRQKAQAKYNSKPIQLKRRAQRNAARRALMKTGAVSKGDGKDVDHRRSNPGGSLSNSRKNLRVRSKTANRSDNKRK